MFHARVLAAAVLLLAPTVRAADIYSQVYVVAHFPRPTGGYTEIITHGSPLPNDGGWTYDSFDFTHGGALCTPFTGQENFFCARASARVEIDRTLVQTTTYIGVRTDIRLKAQARLDYRNGSYAPLQLWGQAQVYIPVICSGSISPPVTGLSVTYALGGEYAVTVSDPAVTVDAPKPFGNCTSGRCVLTLPNFRCPEGDATTTVELSLWPMIQVANPQGHTGWSVQAVSDYSHTFALEGMDVLGGDGQPMPNVRVVVPAADGGVKETFLTAAEHEEAAANSSTTTTTTVVSTSTTGDVTTTTDLSSTSTTAATTTTTTLAPCAGTVGLSAAACRCALPRAATCDGVTLRRPLTQGLTTLCKTIDKAVGSSGKAQRRLARKAAAAARRTLAIVNGGKGKNVPDGCRSALQTLVSAVRSDLATP